MVFCRCVEGGVRSALIHLVNAQAMLYFKVYSPPLPHENNKTPVHLILYVLIEKLTSFQCISFKHFNIKNVAQSLRV